MFSCLIPLVEHYIATSASLLVTFALGIPSAMYILFLTNQVGLLENIKEN